MVKRRTGQEILDLARLYQPACVLTAAAVLDVFSPLHAKPMTAEALAGKLGTDPRATAILLDALAALKLLIKQGEQYSVPEDVAELLTEQSATNVLPMLRHMANAVRRWAELPKIVQTGKYPEIAPSIRGAEADMEAFIGGMDNISKPMAAGVIDKIEPFKFRHILDIGGGPGTWSIAFLLAADEAEATLFDLPAVIPIARQQFAEAGLTDRVNLVGGDYNTDALPEGADLAWLGAICHQNSRQQNRDLFTRTHAALSDEGVIVIRDVIMDSSRTSPPAGALFAINMLVATEAGGTYTFDEYREDLREAGFDEVTLVHQDEFMNSLIHAGKAQK